MPISLGEAKSAFRRLSCEWALANYLRVFAAALLTEVRIAPDIKLRKRINGI
jgi:hypothetical protein